MQPFDLLSCAAAAEMPERLTDIGSWHRHIPFAFALLDMARPRVLVELGTHKGDSYSAFCQGVVSQALPTRCYAVDTWQGDSQAGLYGDDIFADLSSYHDPRYSRFSTLLRMTFDNALEHFADGSVDLLHIDGLHTYEAVRHDFETWLPKMSERGVVLFHDTNVRHGDFAVWRLWEELQREYPAFEFPYGFGLGVLAVGRAVPEPVLRFLEAASAEPQPVVRLFHALGDGIALLRSQHVLGQTQSRLERLGSDLTEARRVVEARDSLLEQYNVQRDALILALEQAREQAVDLERERASRLQLIEQHEHLREALAESIGQYRRADERLQLIANSKLWRGRNALMRLLGQTHRVIGTSVPAASVAWRPDSLPKVDVIIPVYRGLEETRRCIESVLAQPLATQVEVIVIEDASPEPELVAWLDTIADRVTLLRNDRNLGFVGTVNRGMALHPERDVLLLNSDTEVAGDWLDRIQRAAYEHARIASVTPFSNSATICSYPVFCQDNDLPKGMDTAAMDALCQRANAGQRVDIPTAVGFCMYIRRDCLDDCGLFNEELFGKGYGEENEFCMRSAGRGWRHVLCGDVFVYHEGGVSFAETQSENQRIGHRALTRLYPGYDLLIREHIAADPAAHMRFAIDMLRARESGRPVVLMINHGRGGGTEKHLLDMADEVGDHAEIYLLQPQEEGGRVSLGPLNGGKRSRLLFEPGRDFQLLLDTLRDLGVSRIHFHHTIGVHLQFLLLPEQLGVPYDVTVHDYYLACPQVTLADEKGRYCGAPDEAGCNACLETRPAPGGVEISEWRVFGARLLNGAERVFVPSADSLGRMKRYFPDAHFIHVPHEHDLPQLVRIRPLQDDRSLRVLVLGALSVFKGADLLEACALEARRQRAPVEFHLLGFAYRHLSSFPVSNLHVHGAYEDERVDEWLDELRPDVVWFPGSCPETYSYTLSICMRAGLPVVASAIGAFPERLAGRPWSWLVEPDQGAGTMMSLLLDIRERIQGDRAPELQENRQPLGDGFRYGSDYAVALPVPSSPSQPEWAHLHAGWSRLSPVQQVLPAARFPVILRILQRALGWRWTRGLVNRIPTRWKGNIKRVLWRA
ncbi:MULTISPECIES: class I SAM-dependent methyltransferase [unclassified Pseudomonas]|uniref:class I SAM-dependent methyltransferase n=1 Tax=unclassified Pseudomonas TaxID=196821 RepID=UPI0024482C67|nr:MULTISPECIES: class I SAM-dependent methyltransferase [unclassified Pseudomonas]MDG9926760.1 class I SAM-dependent methyltransferase [Pseudomonas sp. GD04042]MDH0482171.1 class I SAM-dependent methyltransferase [Pseudomonas sp. GD04015]MDH0603606.1 class I SAM-dependent methyltransferase [Pseudomonas sp. GD03869]